MQWDLAGYDSHPIDGDAGRVSTLANHLVTVTTDIRSQIDRLRDCDSGEVWESSAGSADAFMEVIDDLPDKLELVAVRYENVASALETYHPVLSDTKQDAEYWIEQAAEAQEEVERCESGVELMEDFAEQAQTDAEAANEDREDGDPEVEPDEWQGENYHESLAAAQEELETAVGNVHSAVEEWESAASTCADAIDEAGNDDLKNESGFFAGLSRAFDSFLDALEVFVDVLAVIGAVVGVITLIVAAVATAPVWLVAAGIAIAATVFVGTLILYFNDRKTGWDVAWAGIGLATAGLGAGGSGFAQFMTGFGGGLAAFDLGLTAGGGSGGDFLEAGYEGFSSIDLPDLDGVYGPIQLPGIDGLDPVAVPRPGGDFTGLSDLEGLGEIFSPGGIGDIDIPQSVVIPLDASIPPVEVPASDVSVDMPEVSGVATVDVPGGGG